MKVETWVDINRVKRAIKARVADQIYEQIRSPISRLVSRKAKGGMPEKYSGRTFVLARSQMNIRIVVGNYR